MKKVSDEIVAKALGWKRCRAEEGSHKKANGCWHPSLPIKGLVIHGKNWKRKGRWHWCQYLPKWTTELETITAELKRLKLAWALDVMPPHRLFAWVEQSEGSAKTAPLALCHALLAYLKENP